jgi:hypothetical protein
MMATISSNHEIAAMPTDNTFDDPRRRAPLILKPDFASVTRTVTAITERKTPFAWYVAFTISLALLGLLGICVIYLFTTGVGVWGNNQPVNWAFDIVNFVF